VYFLLTVVSYVFTASAVGYLEILFSKVTCYGLGVMSDFAYYLFVVGITPTTYQAVSYANQQSTVLVM